MSKFNTDNKHLNHLWKFLAQTPCDNNSVDNHTASLCDLRGKHARLSVL